jgi:predicted acetyltransferase
MDFELIPATRKYKSVIENLMQFYLYDFSEYVRYDVGDDGSFQPYPKLKEYWKQKNKHAYLVKKDEKYAGFVLVKFIESKERNYFSIAEFFIMKKYRREGMGTAVAKQIFDLYNGHWEVYQKENNQPAQIFWNKIINDYTKGRFRERWKDGKRIQDFENRESDSINVE